VYQNADKSFQKILQHVQVYFKHYQKFFSFGEASCDAPPEKFLGIVHHVVNNFLRDTSITQLINLIGIECIAAFSLLN